MNARIASNVETAALLPDGARVKPNQAEFGNLEQAEADYYQKLREMCATINAELEAANVRRVAVSLGIPRSALVGSKEAAAEVLTARVFRGE